MSERLGTIVTVGLLVLVAIGLRGYRLGSPVLGVDEAESALNALTIVADGVPGDHFLGRRCTRTRSSARGRRTPSTSFGTSATRTGDWPCTTRGFRCTRSRRPFVWPGVTSDVARARHTAPWCQSGRIDYWTAVPRMPAVAFGAILVVAAWDLGLRMHSYPAALRPCLCGGDVEFFRLCRPPGPVLLGHSSPAAPSAVSPSGTRGVVAVSPITRLRDLQWGCCSISTR